MQKGREIVSGVQDPAAHGPGGKEYQAALCFAWIKLRIQTLTLQMGIEFCMQKSYGISLPTAGSFKSIFLRGADRVKRV